jgi:hypothetical protein
LAVGIEDLHFHFFCTGDDAENLQVLCEENYVFEHSTYDDSKVVLAADLWNYFLQSGAIWI